MSNTNPSVISILDSNGSSKIINWDQFTNEPQHSLTWLHLNYTDNHCIHWLENESNLPAVVIEALLADDARPRCFSMNGGLLVILRGVNFNPDRDPEDMVSIRMWLQDNRIITLFRQNVLAIKDIFNELSCGDGPKNAGDFLVDLADNISTRMTDLIFNIDSKVDDLEDEILNHSNLKIRTTLSSLRRQIIRLKRYLIPQREVMAHLQVEKVDWLTSLDRAHLREVSDRTIRYLEDMNSAKERASIAQDELESRVNAQMNRNMYVISIITAIFLPLGFITGLFGTNVAGLPGLQDPNAFLLLCGALAIVTTIQIIFFKIMKWM